MAAASTMERTAASWAVRKYAIIPCPVINVHARIVVATLADRLTTEWVSIPTATVTATMLNASQAGGASDGHIRPRLARRTV
jgi:hypothetical protein